MHGKNPTREQRKLMQRWKLDSTMRLVVKDIPSEMVLVHRYSDKTTRTIRKGVTE